MKLSHGVCIAVLIALVAGCGRRELILEGERFGVREALGATGEADTATTPENVAKPIALPPQQAVTEWPQIGSNARHLPPHAALGARISEAWSVSIGSGNSKKYAITAEPIVAEGRVFTLDSRSRVMAHSTSGAALWSADLTPPSERNEDATGGGLAYGDGRLFVTTGFGILVAMDPATGQVLWEQKTDAVLTGAPTYYDGLVYVVGRDNRAWAVEAEFGRVQWQFEGVPSPSGMLGGAAPAVTERLAIFPFGSSELAATLRKSGVRVWGAAISGQRRGRVYASITDITGDPVVSDGRIYVGTQSGRTAALSTAGGDRIWTAEEGAYSPVLPVGDSVFLVSDEARLVRLDAETGQRIWAVDLPYFQKRKPKRYRKVYAHYGPVLAGGRLVVASDDGLIRFFSPQDGSLLDSLEIGSGAAADPVIAGGTLYLVTADGRLHAFR